MISIRAGAFALMVAVAPAIVLGANGMTLSVPSGIDDGDLIVIASDGDVDFGDLGPTLIYYNDLSGFADGDVIITGAAGSPANPLGIGEVVGAGLIVAEQPELPYGRGIEVGESSDCGGGKLRVNAPYEASEWYLFQYFMFPESHQDNMVEIVTSTWQIKCNWFFYGPHGYAHTNPTPDIWDTVPQQTSSGSWWQRAMTSSNKGEPASNGNPSIIGWLSEVDEERWVSDPINKQIWIKMSPIPGSAQGSDGFYLTSNTATGRMQAEDLENAGFFHSADCTTTTVDRFTTPGHPQGFPCDDIAPANVLFSQLYFTWGPGAPARVEITDSDVYENSSKHSLCTIVSWENGEISATLRSGIFYDIGLNCKHVHVFNANNDYVGYVGQIECDGATDLPGQPSPVILE